MNGLTTCACPVFQSKQLAGDYFNQTMAVAIPESDCGTKNSNGQYVNYCDRNTYMWNSIPALMVTPGVMLVPNMPTCPYNSPL